MQFSIILSIDVPSSVRIGEILNSIGRKVRRKLTQTEGKEQFEYGYLEGDWKGGDHRKLCGLLSRDAFDDLCCRLGLQAEDVETMGSLGAPGFGVGWSPAISFRAADTAAIVEAYVTPVPEFEATREPNPKAWDRVKKAVLAVYG